jgi:NADH dehydrogenase [ubiquinone] 1 alpha subcomplex assembly factor 6
MTTPLEELRRQDRERFAQMLFAPVALRDDLAALYLFNADLARVREVVREPLAGRIRLQWWRDSLDGVFSGAWTGSPVAEGLSRIAALHALTRSLVEEMIEAREQDLDAEPPASLEGLKGYAAATGGALAELAAELLGGRDQASRRAARLVGTAYALAGLLRALPFHLAQGRRHMPSALFGETIAGPDPRLSQAVETVARAAQDALDEARALRAQVSSAALSPLLAARQTSLHLKRLQRAGYNPFDSRLAYPATRPLALWLSALTGRW